MALEPPYIRVRPWCRVRLRSRALGQLQIPLPAPAYRKLCRWNHLSVCGSYASSLLRASDLPYCYESAFLICFVCGFRHPRDEPTILRAFFFLACLPDMKALPSKINCSPGSIPITTSQRGRPHGHWISSFLNTQRSKERLHFRQNLILPSRTSANLSCCLYSMTAPIIRSSADTYGSPLERSSGCYAKFGRG